MTRPLRIEYAGALYHVMSRGNRRQTIFENDDDRRTFLRILSRVIRSHDWICHAYCLMGNHYHLLIETLEPNLSRGMRDLNSEYTQKFNYNHKTVGHLLQGRYKAILVEKEEYLTALARYIALNPVRSNLVAKPQDWRWSSYRPTAGYSHPPFFLTIKSVLSIFSKNKVSAQKKYKEFVENNLHASSPIEEEDQRGMVAGSPDFHHEMWHKTDNSRENVKAFQREERMVSRPSLEEIFKEVKTKEKRNIAMVFAYRRCRYLITEIARFIGLDESTVGKIIRSRTKW